MSEINSTEELLIKARKGLDDYYFRKVVGGPNIKITQDDKVQINTIIEVVISSLKEKSGDFWLFCLLKLYFALPSATISSSEYENEWSNWLLELQNLLSEKSEILIENYNSSEAGFDLFFNYVIGCALVKYLNEASNPTFILSGALTIGILHNKLNIQPLPSASWAPFILSFLNNYMHEDINNYWKPVDLPKEITPFSPEFTLSALPKQVEGQELSLVNIEKFTREAYKGLTLLPKKIQRTVQELREVNEYIEQFEIQQKLLWWLNVRHSKSFSPEIWTSYRSIQPSSIAGIYMGFDLINLIDIKRIPVPDHVSALLIECFYTTQPDAFDTNKKPWASLINEPLTIKYIDKHLPIWKVIIPFISNFLPSSQLDEEMKFDALEFLIIFFKLIQAQRLID